MLLNSRSEKIHWKVTCHYWPLLTQFKANSTVISHYISNGVNRVQIPVQTEPDYQHTIFIALIVFKSQ